MATRNVSLIQGAWTQIATGKCLATLESGDECYFTLSATQPSGINVPKHLINNTRGLGFYNDGSFSGTLYAWPVSVKCVIAVSE